MCKVIEEKQIAKIFDFEVVAFTECFKISLIEDDKSAKTIESYVGDIKAFIEFLRSKGVEFNGTLQRFYIVSYKNFLVESNYEVATINKKINSIHALNRYLVAAGAMKEIVVENSIFEGLAQLLLEF